jgi:hypothetical protein
MTLRVLVQEDGDDEDVVLTGRERREEPNVGRIRRRGVPKFQ